MVSVVLLPGMDGSATLFEPFIRALGRQHEIQAVAYPADRPLGYVELQAFVRSALPQSGRFVVLGESFSGPVAIALAAKPPEGLLGIVLCCSFARNPRPFLACLGWAMRLVPIKAIPAGFLAWALLGEYSSPFWRTALARALAPVTPATVRARVHSVLAVDAAAQLAKSKVPVLYLRATQDRVVPRSASRLVERAGPAVNTISIPGPHFLLQVCPEPAAAAVREFISSLQPVVSQAPQSSVCR